MHHRRDDLTYGSSADLVPVAPAQSQLIVGLLMIGLVWGQVRGKIPNMRYRIRSYSLPHNRVQFRRKENARLGNTVAPTAFTELGRDIAVICRSDNRDIRLKFVASFRIRSHAEPTQSAWPDTTVSATVVASLSFDQPSLIRLLCNPTNARWYSRHVPILLAK